MEGFWWPNLHKHVENYVHHCDQCSLSPPMRYVILFHINPMPKWSSYLVQYLKSQTLDNSMPKHWQQAIKMEAASYTLIGDELYRRGKDGNLRLCVPEEKYLELLHHAHVGIPGGHFSGDAIAKNILWSGLWWPTMFSDVVEFEKCCDACQWTKQPLARDKMPLHPILASCAFAERGIDFVGPINPPY